MADAADDSRYHTSPWRLAPGGWWTVAKRVASRVQNHRLMLKAAGVSFYGFLSLFPALAAVVFLYGLLTDVSDLQSHLTSLAQALPPGVMEVISARLEAVVKSTNAAEVSFSLAFSLLFSLWSGSRGVAALIELIGMAYRQPDNRSLIHSAVLSLVITIGMIMMLILTLLAVAGIPALTKLLYLPSLFEQVVLIARWPVVLIAVATSLAILYQFAPDRRRMAKLRWVLPGVLLATSLWGTMSVLFSVYVETFGNYEATFGALASIVILLLWLNYSVVIIALGAELNAELELTTKVDTTVSPSMPMGKRGATVADNVRPV